MSPILVRPVREQLEHDRVIRLLQAKYKRKFDVAINPGHEQTAPVGDPPPWYPDLVLHSTDKVRRLAGVVEVETAESVNHLEAMSQWGAFSKLGVSFHLYVPAGSVDTAKRLCAEFQIAPAETWTYAAMGDQIRFTLVHKVPDPAEVKAPQAPSVKAAAVKPAPAKPAATSAAKAKAATESSTPARRPRAAAPVPAAKGAARPEAARKTPARVATRPPARPARAGASNAASRAKKSVTRRTAASTTRARATKTAVRPTARKATARSPKRK